VAVNKTTFIYERLFVNSQFELSTLNHIVFFS